MAYYGIPSAGQALTAGVGNDTVALANLGGTLITAQSVYGGDGNDIVSLGAVGFTATASATIVIPSLGFGTGTPGNETALSGSHVVSGEAYLIGSASKTYNSGTTYTYASGGTGSTINPDVVGVITSQQAVRTVNAAYFQGNAGNDSIIFGDGVTRVSSTTFAGGAGADVIGSYTNVNNQFTAATNSALFVGVDIEGGNGNDTIYLDNEAFSALNINANKGADKVEFIAFSALENSIIGLGADNDTFSAATIGSAASSTIAGGKGNDSISVEFTEANNVIIGGDRANANPLVGDGNDSIMIIANNAFSAGTIYGGGGNDTVTFSGEMTAATVSLGAGADVFSANEGTTIQDTTIGLGKDGDHFRMIDGNKVISSRLNLGKGADTVDFDGADVGSGTDFSATTINGGAGADLILRSAAMAGAGSSVIAVEYLANSESTISAYDTVALDVNGSGTYTFQYEPGATRAAFSAAGLTATNGVVTFSSTFATDVTARASAISTNTSNSEAAAFFDGSGNAFLFVKGSSDNLVVQVGSAASLSAIDGLTIRASKSFSLEIEA
jgi:hypothetical protein